MLNSWLIETNCHSCGDTIDKGRWFCKTCGRSRGINRILQFKKWELLAALVGSSIAVGLCLMALTSLLTGLRNAVAVNESPDISSLPLISENNGFLQVTATKRSTNTRIPQATKTPKNSEFANYSCLDKSKVKLRVGSRAIVSLYDVNLRSSPKVPDVWDANIVVMLRQGDKMLVIGGPKCAHEGTWWEVQTDSGYAGWIREMQPNKVLLEPLD